MNTAAVPKRDAKMRQLQALLPYYHRIFRRRRFSDGKLSLSCEVGGDLPDLVGADLVQSTIAYADSIYLEFGADTHVEGVTDGDEIRAIRKRAIAAGLKLVDCPIRHMGTEKSPEDLSRH